MTEKIPADPLVLFDKWFREAKSSEINDPNAMALAVVDVDGRPSVRIVLMKAFGPEGITFFTNRNSQKGRSLEKHPDVELCFYWKSLQKQVRIRGPAKKTSDSESDAYFKSRMTISKIGAWASAQSQPMDHYETLVQKVKEFEEKYGEEEDIPRPPYWGGYRVVPDRIEFWAGQPYRLHKRFIYIKEGSEWKRQWLYP